VISALINYVLIVFVVVYCLSVGVYLREISPYRRCHLRKVSLKPVLDIEVFSRSLGRIYIARQTNNGCVELYMMNNAL